jgi:methyl-accepting chemotaxis protein-1 (serine sensor receptor)
MWGLHDVHETFSGYFSGVDQRAAAAAQLGQAMEMRAVEARNALLAPDAAGRTGPGQRGGPPGGPEASGAVPATAAGGQGHVRGGQNQGPGLIDVEASYAPVALSILDLTARGEHDAAVAKLNAECVPLLARLDTAMDDYQALTEVRRRRSRTGR